MATMLVVVQLWVKSKFLLNTFFFGEQKMNIRRIFPDLMFGSTICIFYQLVYQIVCCKRTMKRQLEIILFACSWILVIASKYISISLLNNSQQPSVGCLLFGSWGVCFSSMLLPVCGLAVLAGTQFTPPPPINSVSVTCLRVPLATTMDKKSMMHQYKKSWLYLKLFISHQNRFQYLWERVWSFPVI